jgi:hypothetical protein
MFGFRQISRIGQIVEVSVVLPCPAGYSVRPDVVERVVEQPEVERLELPDPIREVTKDEQIGVLKDDLLPSWKGPPVGGLLVAGFHCG